MGRVAYPSPLGWTPSALSYYLLVPVNGCLTPHCSTLETFLLMPSPLCAVPECVRGKDAGEVSKGGAPSRQGTSSMRVCNPRNAACFRRDGTFSDKA